MELSDLELWMDRLSMKDWYWYVKRLAGNDTLLNGSHQAGPYIPKNVMRVLAPRVMQSTTPNPEEFLTISIDSHSITKDVRAIWYNSKSRNECRITRFGGASSPILDPESTGSILIIAFHARDNQSADEVRAWLSHNVDEENVIEDRIGPIEPYGKFLIFQRNEIPEVLEEAPKIPSCQLTPEEMPEGWLEVFPSPIAIAMKAVSLRPDTGISVDERLMKRRDCEFTIFRAVEEVHILPVIKNGFITIEGFLDFSKSVDNRRKSRAGRSLELQTKAIFDEEHIAYSHGGFSEPNKRPDFLFPSAEAYQRGTVPEDRLRMLALKTTCKDRWRQILNEADKIKSKHLLTLQEGVSENQFDEMRAANVILVVPEGLHRFYSKKVKPQLLSLEDFLREVRS
jgi:hypothetical protein